MTKKEYKEILDLVIDIFINCEEKEEDYYITGSRNINVIHIPPLSHYLKAKIDEPIMKMNQYIIKRKKDLP